MAIIKLTAQEKHTWKHSKYEIQAHGLAEAESGWGWDGENPYSHLWQVNLLRLGFFSVEWTGITIAIVKITESIFQYKRIAMVQLDPNHRCKWPLNFQWQNLVNEKRNFLLHRRTQLEMCIVTLQIEGFSPSQPQPIEPQPNKWCDNIS